MPLAAPFSFIAIVASLASPYLRVTALLAVTPVAAQARALTQEQAAAAAAYDKALRDFSAILAERRAQIDGEAAAARRGRGRRCIWRGCEVMSTYKDLTDAVPARIGRGNKFGVPPAYFDAAIEPLIDEYAAVFKVMQAPPAGAQESKTPFKDVADLGRAIARAKGLDAATVDAAGRISLGHLLRRDQRQPEHRQRALQHLQGQPADGRRGGSQGARARGRR